MLSLLFPFPAALAWPVALLCTGLCFTALWRRPAFAVLLGLLILCRLIMAGDFLLAANGQAYLAAILGALKDFTFMAPLLFLTGLRGGKTAAGLAAAVLIFFNALDVVYIKETFFRVQRALFENTDPAAPDAPGPERFLARFLLRCSSAAQPPKFPKAATTSPMKSIWNATPPSSSSRTAPYAT